MRVLDASSFALSCRLVVEASGHLWPRAAGILRWPLAGTAAARGVRGASSWSAQAPALAAAGYNVHVPERRGHAHTPDVEGPLTYEVLATEPELDLASLGLVAAPTLVLQGDRDEVTLEHGAAVAAALPHGRLAVLPGTHALPMENPEVVNELVLWFLAGATPAVDWPVPGRGP